MPSHDAIWVEHGDELEDKHVSERVSSRVVFPQDEVQEAVEDERGRRLAGVHAAAQEKHLPKTHVQKSRQIM